MRMIAPSLVQIIYNFSQPKILSTLISLFLKMMFQTGVLRGEKLSEKEKLLLFNFIFFSEQVVFILLELK